MSDNTLISRGQLCAMLHISDTTRQRLERSDPTFPTKVRTSPRLVAYFRSEAVACVLRS